MMSEMIDEREAYDRINESVSPDNSTAFYESVKHGIVRIVCLIHCAGLYQFPFTFNEYTLEGTLTICDY